MVKCMKSMAAGYAVNLTIEPSETFMVTHPLTQKFGRRTASGVTGVKVGRSHSGGHEDENEQFGLTGVVGNYRKLKLTHQHHSTSG